MVNLYMVLLSNGNWSVSGFVLYKQVITYNRDTLMQEKTIEKAVETWMEAEREELGKLPEGILKESVDVDVYYHGGFPNVADLEQKDKDKLRNFCKSRGWRFRRNLAKSKIE